MHNSPRVNKPFTKTGENESSEFRDSGIFSNSSHDSLLRTANGETLKTSADSNRSSTGGQLNTLQNCSLIQKPKCRVEGLDTEEERLASFAGGWPAEHIVKASDVAHAGLYFTGSGDRAKCVYCFGAMYNWDVGDDPLQEHTRHFGECPYLKYLISVGLYTKLDFFTTREDSYSITYVNDNWINLTSVIIMKKLGFSEELIIKSKPIFLSQQKLSVQKHFAGVLIDIIIEQENRQLEGQAASLDSLSQSSPTGVVHQNYKPPVTRSPYQPPAYQSDDGFMEGNSLENSESFIPSTFQQTLPREGSSFPTVTLDPTNLGRKSDDRGFIMEKSVPGVSQHPTYSLQHQDPSISSTRPKDPQNNSETLSPPSSYQSTVQLDEVRQENIRLKKITKCHVCGKDANILFLPCRHITTCEECSTKFTKCNRCQKNIIGTIKIYL